MLVIFQGFEVGSRGNDIWNHYSTSWGFTLAAWIMIGVLCLVFVGWLVNGYVVHKEWSLRVPSIRSVDLNRGIAPKVAPDTTQIHWLKKWRNWVLNAI